MPSAGGTSTTLVWVGRSSACDHRQHRTTRVTNSKICTLLKTVGRRARLSPHLIQNRRDCITARPSKARANKQLHNSSFYRTVLMTAVVVVVMMMVMMMQVKTECWTPAPSTTYGSAPQEPELLPKQQLE
eukprot:1161103-Pelagomonas_calceolata.AAC.3